MFYQPTQKPSLAALALASLAASGVTLAATLFKTNERDLTFTTPVWDTFSNAFGIAVVPVLFYFVLLTMFGLLGLLGNWWRGLISGTVSVVIASVLGYVLRVVSNGVEVNRQVWAAIFGELLGLNFPLVVAGMLSAAFVAPAVLRKLGVIAGARYSASVGVPAGEIANSGSAFLRVPSDALLEQLGAGADAANAQWESLVSVFEKHGWGTQAVDGGSQAAAGDVLVGDAALVLGEHVIMARPAADEQRAGLASVRETLEAAGAVFDELEAPAVFDPADVVEGSGVVYVGRTSRTNAAAVRALRRILGARGYRVVVVLVAGDVRLSEALSVLPDGTRIIWREGLRTPEVLGQCIAAQEPRGAAVVALSSDVLAVPADAKATAELLEELGYLVERVDISAFHAIGASLPRLSLRSRD